MSPFTKNFQRLLIFFFVAASAGLVIMGVARSKSSTLSTAVTPGQGSTPIPPPQNTPPPQGASAKFTGRTYQTPWGNVVASISVANGKIVGVTMPQVPPSPPSQYAEPYLVQQALAAGSANIQGVSGATYTSIAFKSSLEDAISQAGTQGQAIIPSSGNSGAMVAPLAKPSIPRSYQDDDY